MAKFKAGDMIIGNLTMSDGTVELRVFMVNRIVPPSGQFSWETTDFYSLDNGSGFIDGRMPVATIDATFELCDEVDKREK